MEIRGLGIIHVPSLFGVSSIRRKTELDLVIDLKMPSGEEDRTGVLQETIDIVGVNVPLITLPVRSGRDMANIVEVAALNQKLKELSHDAAKELDDKIITRLSEFNVNDDVKSRKLKIENEYGIHARPAALIVKEAARYTVRYI